VNRAAALTLLLLAGPLAGPLAAADLKVIVEPNAAPYRLVRVKATGVPSKSNVKWYVTAADPANQPRIEFAPDHGLKSREPAFVAPPGAYKVALRVIYLDAAGVPDFDEAEALVTIGPPAPPVPPLPPVPPGPTPPGPTPPAPAPIPKPGLRVLIVEETGERAKLTAGQREVIFGGTVRDYLRTHCATDPQNPDGAFRIWDKDVNSAGDPDNIIWRSAMIRPRPGPLPWVVISNGTTGYEGPLPADTTGEKFIALLKQYEGK
jgi:hypothetical protein